MKEIGRTTEGNYMVEITPDEYRALNELAMALEGRGLWDIRATLPKGVFNSSLSGVLGLLVQFAHNRAQVNQLVRNVQALQATLSPGGDR